MHEYNRGYTVAVDPRSSFFLPFSRIENPHDYRQIEPQYQYTSDKSPFLAYRAENKVGALLGNEVELGLGAFEESLAGQSAGAYGYLGLVDIVPCAHQVLGDAQQILYPVAVMRLEYIVEYEVHREDQHQGQSEGQDVDAPALHLIADIVDNEPDEEGSNDNQQPVLLRHAGDA